MDLGWSKTTLREETGISSSSLAKLGKGENVTTDGLLKICTVMDCIVEDIMETVKD
ncbi:helix-turn-helix domain-containing protein [Aerococcaceae bacterium NML160702]|nr:helix-turn-helix domain-containing protein [Aerococcaceae bacterium NML160702]